MGSASFQDSGTNNELPKPKPLIPTQSVSRAQLGAGVFWDVKSLGLLGGSAVSGGSAMLADNSAGCVVRIDPCPQPM